MPTDTPDLTKPTTFAAALDASASANEQPIVGASGDLWAAPARTAKPAITADPPAEWTRLGLLSDDGAAFGNSRDTADIMVWQSLYAARRLTTSLENTLKFSMASWSRASMTFAFAGGTWTGDATTGYTYTPPAPGSEEERAVLLRWVDGTFTGQLYLPRCVVSENEDLSLKRDEGAFLGVTITALGETGVPAWLFDSLDVRFAPAP
ncbi:hypothetical protein [Actinomadura rayongensis]|uniref:Phage tail protein n=1 Tax=Actinomadura rayongensis TaxID=1429076 RepID=A0A6I4WDA4_9ACTN|nr:hypothetical protein [Actinomadura rayongensis]MXQ67698.1 hypothetical protein [Actinomadura rayongensis]